MAETYIDKNRDGAALTFYKRVVYNYDAVANINQYENLTDFNFGEKFLYGRVNYQYVPIYLPKQSMARLKPLNDATGDNAGGPEQSAINFVVDAFKDLQQVFQKAVAQGQLDPNHPYLSNLNVYKSFVSPIDLFNTHQDNYSTAIENYFRDKKIQVKNFHEFMKHLRPLLMKSVKQYPFTFSAFLKSRYCPINASGLAIEVADLDYFDDSKKMKYFIRSGHWEYFLNACRSFGFMVDKNIPWRIVADIGSNEMLQYAARYRLQATGRILNIGYNRADYIYYEKFRKYLLRLYNTVKLPKIPIIEECNGRIRTRHIVPESYSEEQLTRIFTDRQLLTFLFEIRMHEEPKEFTKPEKKTILRDCLSIYDRLGPSRAGVAFERTINHPFDYRGSLSYNVNRNKKGYGEKIVLSKSRR